MVAKNGGQAAPLSARKAAVANVPHAHWQHQVHVNQFLVAILAEEKCAQAGVELAYYEFPNSIAATPEGWQVDCSGFGTKRRILCKQVIDCTGGATVVGMLGLPRMRGSQTQPGSMLFLLDDVYRPGRMQLKAVYVTKADSSNSRTVTAANLAGRKAVLDKVRTERARLMHLQPEAAHLESHRIVGETVITVDDYTSGRLFEDAICYAFYPVDLHTDDGVKPQPLAHGVVPTIPLGAPIPRPGPPLAWCRWRTCAAFYASMAPSFPASDGRGK